MTARKRELKERQAAEVATLRAEIAESQAKLNRPPKTPDNSSLPPSRRHKRTEFAKSRGKRNPHKGAHRPLDPNPTHRRDVKVPTNC